MNIVLMIVAMAVCWISYTVAYPATDKVMENFERISGNQGVRTKEAFEYMRKYGHLNRRPLAMTWGDYTKSMKSLQKMMGVPQTGIADDDTYEHMQKPRCGNPDGHVYSLQDLEDWDEDRDWAEGLYPGSRMKRARSKREGYYGETFVRDITYKVTAYKAGIIESDFDRAVANAAKKWAAVTTLTFTPTNCSEVDFEILFGPNLHGSPVCDYPFYDNLAHAYYPSGPLNDMNGDIHFNDAYKWVMRPPRESIEVGWDMECTAVHEFGHSLGLPHIFVAEAIMNPYTNDCEYLPLHVEDIFSIQWIYGDENTPYGYGRTLSPECIDSAKIY